jgi:hypothetical protein
MNGYSTMTPLDDRIAALMHQCVGGASPRYAHFYLELDALASSGIGPRALCLSLAGNLQRVMSAMHAFSTANPGLGPADVDDETKRQLLGWFNGFKLVQGFVSLLPPEMRELIERTSAVPTMGPEHR